MEDVDFFRMLDYVLRLGDSETIIGTSHESQESQLLSLDNQEFISGILARAI